MCNALVRASCSTRQRQQQQTEAGRRLPAAQRGAQVRAESHQTMAPRLRHSWNASMSTASTMKARGTVSTAHTPQRRSCGFRGVRIGCCPLPGAGLRCVPLPRLRRWRCRQRRQSRGALAQRGGELRRPATCCVVVMRSSGDTIRKTCGASEPRTRWGAGDGAPVETARGAVLQFDGHPVMPCWPRTIDSGRNRSSRRRSHSGAEKPSSSPGGGAPGWPFKGAPGRPRPALRAAGAAPR